MRIHSAMAAITLGLALAQGACAADLDSRAERDVRPDGREPRMVMGGPPPVGRVFYNPGRPTEYTYVVHPLVPVETRTNEPIRARY